MAELFAEVWLWSLAAFLLGAVVAWALFVRPLSREVRTLRAEIDDLHASDLDMDVDAWTHRGRAWTDDSQANGERAGYRESGHRDSGYRDSGYRDSGYRDTDYRDLDPRDFGGADADRDFDDRDFDDRDFGDRDFDRDPAPGSREVETFSSHGASDDRDFDDHFTGYQDFGRQDTPVAGPSAPATPDGGGAHRSGWDALNPDAQQERSKQAPATQRTPAQQQTSQQPRTSATGRIEPAQQADRTATIQQPASPQQSRPVQQSTTQQSATQQSTTQQSATQQSAAEQTTALPAQSTPSRDKQAEQADPSNTWFSHGDLAGPQANQSAQGEESSLSGKLRSLFEPTEVQSGANPATAAGQVSASAHTSQSSPSSQPSSQPSSLSQSEQSDEAESGQLPRRVPGASQRSSSAGAQQVQHDGTHQIDPAGTHKINPANAQQIQAVSGSAPDQSGHNAGRGEGAGPGQAANGAAVAAEGEYTIKGHFASRQYHTPDSPYFNRITPEVWFRSAAEAEHAGFEAWDGQRRS